MKRSLFIVLAGFLCCTSCSKSNNNGGSVVDIITAHQWFVKDATINTVHFTCPDDDYFTFSTNGTGYRDVGLTKCDTGEQQDYIFNYTVSSDNQSLYVTNYGRPGKNLTLNIRQLTPDIFEFVYTDSIYLYDYVLVK